MNILLTVAYDGTRYAGWQRQKNALAVQQVLEEALTNLAGHLITVTGASRTDAGVHALGQRACFRADLKVPMDKLPYVINAQLPKDVAVQSAEQVPDDFNPRFCARWKTYVYQIYNAPFPNPLTRLYAVHVPQPLDFDKMRHAAGHFIGRHDFTAFCASDGGKTIYIAPEDIIYAINSADKHNVQIKTAVRNIFACDIQKQDALLKLTITGDGFLYNMVRIVAGTIMYAGLGKIHPDEVPAILLSRDRKRAGKTMPPEGLTLFEVGYV